MAINKKFEKGFIPANPIFTAVCPSVKGRMYLLSSVSNCIREKIRGCGGCTTKGRCKLLGSDCVVSEKMQAIENFYNSVEMRPKKQ